MTKVNDPEDPRFAVAAGALHLTVEQVRQQHGLLGPDLIYAWEKPLGHTVIVNRKSQVRVFDDGVLMPQALREFRQRYPEIT